MEDRRVVIIGFDGATWSLIKPWAERGVLPTFAKLMKKGSWGYLQSTMPPVTFPAWKSFSTGKNPGKFGLFAHIKLEKGKLKVCNAETVKDNREMWDELSDHDKKVAVIGVPITYPPKKVNGIMVSGPFSVGHNYTYPKDLENKLRKKYNYDPFPEEFLMSKEKDYKLLMNNIKPKFDFLEDVLAKNYDFVCDVIFETDTAQHFLWGTKGLKELWRYIDERMGKIVRTIDRDPRTLLFLCSDHGFHEMKGAFYVNEWLRKKGYLKLKRKFAVLKVMSKCGITSGRIYGMIKKLHLLKLVRKIFSPETLRKVGKSIPTDKNVVTDQGLAAIVDIEKSKAFFFQGGIYINDRGIERKLYDELKGIKDDAGNHFLDVTMKTDEYSGDYMDDAPDFLVWSDTYHPKGHVSVAGSKTINTSLETEKWVATHHKKGIFLAYGNSIKKGHRIDPHIYDIAPTVLSVFGIEPSPEMDGKVLGEIME